MKRLGQCANRNGGILKDMGGQTAPEILKREKLTYDKDLSPKQQKYMDRNNDGSISGADFAMMDFDFNSKKSKNKRDYTAKPEMDYSPGNIFTRQTEGTIKQQAKLRAARGMMDKDMGGKTLYKKYCRKGRK